MLTTADFPTVATTKLDYQVSVENVVASGKLEQHLDLKMISGSVPGARYNPKKFPGLFFNLKSPKSLLLLFNSGKIISMGTRSVRQAKRAIVNAVRELRSMGMVTLAEPRIEIQNMVACADLKARIDLEDLALNLRKTIYEPENFPGLIYVMDEPKVTLLLFTNGKIVCAGAKSENDVYRAVAKIHDTLETKGLIEPDTSETIAESRPSPQTEIHAQRQEPEEIACLPTNSSA
jgi:transcription initiation factor TFIID TATA-box-binding protein